MQRDGSNEKAPDAERLARLNEKLDDALLGTFPASDPIAINCDGPAENTKPEGRGVPSPAVKK